MDKKKGLVSEFKEFIMRGNVMDLAVGVVIGSAFTAIVTAVVECIINPIVSTIIGDFYYLTGLWKKRRLMVEQ